MNCKEKTSNFNRMDCEFELMTASNCCSIYTTKIFALSLVLEANNSAIESTYNTDNLIKNISPSILNDYFRKNPGLCARQDSKQI